MSEVAIRVEGVSKNFSLAHERNGTLKSKFTSIVKGRKNRKIEVQHALKDISFEINEGEFFGIVGRNGSGKSTLLKILAGIYQPTKGKVSVRGKLVPFIELGVGFNPELTGRENVYLNGALLGFARKEIDAFYNEVVAFAELERFMDKKLKNYSSGMQVRLAFSMAVRANADILLIDEVLAVGDADFQRKCYEYFRKLKKEKKTVVFVSHDMDAIREFCDRAIMIESSEIVSTGNTKQVSDAYQKLFTEQVEQSKASDTQRWGQGNVVAHKVALEKKSVSEGDDTIRLRVTLKGASDNKDLMTGIRFNNSLGHVMFEFNTWNEELQLPELGQKETCEVVWELPNIYSDGIYTIDVYVYGRGNVVYDMLDGAATLSVRRKQHSPFMVTPPFKVHVSRKTKQ